MTPDNGVIAQLGERIHGMDEVVGSIPTNSTTHSKALRRDRNVYAWTRSGSWGSGNATDHRPDFQTPLKRNMTFVAIRSERCI